MTAQRHRVIESVTGSAEPFGLDHGPADGFGSDEWRGALPTLSNRVMSERLVEPREQGLVRRNVGTSRPSRVRLTVRRTGFGTAPLNEDNQANP